MKISGSDFLIGAAVGVGFGALVVYLLKSSVPVPAPLLPSVISPIPVSPPPPPPSTAPTLHTLLVEGPNFSTTANVGDQLTIVPGIGVTLYPSRSSVSGSSVQMTAGAAAGQIALTAIAAGVSTIAITTSLASSPTLITVTVS